MKATHYTIGDLNLDAGFLSKRIHTSFRKRMIWKNSGSLGICYKVRLKLYHRIGFVLE
jgi:hypothetical protein